MFSKTTAFRTLTQEISKQFLDSAKLIVLNSVLIMKDPIG